MLHIIFENKDRRKKKKFVKYNIPKNLTKMIDICFVKSLLE